MYVLPEASTIVIRGGERESVTTSIKPAICTLPQLQGYEYCPFEINLLR